MVVQFGERVVWAGKDQAGESFLGPSSALAAAIAVDPAPKRGAEALRDRASQPTDVRSRALVPEEHE